MRTSVLALSHLFPNRLHRNYGVFVLNRLKAVQQFCSVKVIAPVQWYPFMQRLGRGTTKGMPARENIEGLDVFHPRFAIIPRYFKWIDAVSYLWSAARVAMLLEKQDGFRFDVVDVHWTYPDIVAGYWLARRRRKKLVVTLRGHEAFYEEDGRSIRRWLVASLLRRADFVVALSEELRQKAQNLGVAAERSCVVLNGVDLGNFNYMDRDACRARLGLSTDKRILISVGRLTQRKGHHELIRIMPKLLEGGDTELFIIGGVNREDDFGTVLRDMIRDLKLTTVHIVDRVPHDELALWYGSADLFCLATATEGCPNAVLEALACGTPVIATRVGAIDELITDGDNGSIVDPNDLSNLDDVVSAGLKRQWDRKHIASQMQAWSWRACAERVVAVYGKVLQQAPAVNEI
jgi:teichuronic acid biosynthesis glycosyltransferase TuaC